MDFPVIDIADIDEQDSQLSIARQITEASRTWGFLLLKNHPISKDEIEEMFSLARKFFVDTAEEFKEPWPVNDTFVGYNRALTDSRKNDKASMWFAGRPTDTVKNIDSMPPFWRSHLSEVESFQRSCHGLIVKLLVCFALAMELPDKSFFAKAHSEDASIGNQFRMIHYPARASQPPEATTRMSAHTDSGSVTLLFQDVAGLEVEGPDGDWVAAPFIKDHILVNLGDALAFWSGANLKSTRHRVTFDGVPHDKDRLSMAYFGKASPDTVLEPVKSTDSDKINTYESNGLILRPGITVGEFTKRIMAGIYGNAVAQDGDAGTPSQVKAAA